MDNGVEFGSLTFNANKTVTVTQWGKTDDNGVRNDCIWNIAKNYGESTIGRELSNSEVTEIMNEIAEAMEGSQDTQEKLEQTISAGDEIVIPLEAQVKTLTTAVGEAIKTRDTLVGELADLQQGVSSAATNCSTLREAYLNAKAAQTDENPNTRKY